MARRVLTPKGKSVRLEGVNELVEQFEHLGALNTRRAKEIKRIHMGAALVIRDEARDLAPEIQSDPKNPKKWQFRGALKKAIFAAYGKDSDPQVLVGVNYKIAPQAHWVEFGTEDRETKKSHANRGKVTPQSYMRAALTACRAKCVTIIAAGYRSLIAEIK